MIIYSEQLQVSDMRYLFSPDRITHTELATLAAFSDT